ncbi:MAG: hypothetical protein KF900_11575 [Bacteroidetes bacterium]|nr:hypothetical protein [Bacteroidota bacterium]
MARTAQAQSIEREMTNYFNSLSDKNKQAVLTVVKTIAEAEEEAEFERDFSNSVPLEEARKHTLNTVRKLFNEKNRSHKK